MNRLDPPELDLTEARSIGGILSTAARLYGRYPALFPLLAASVMVPYQLLIILFGNSALVTGSNAAVGGVALVALISLALIAPLVAALELQAVVALGAGEHPELGTIYSQALRVLLGVAAAQIIAAIMIVAGLFLFIIPGIFAAVRLAVVAQTAAFERTSWPTTIGRSWAMTSGRFFHVLGVILAVALLNYLVGALVGSILSSASVTVDVIGTMAVAVLTQSFGALVLGLLYFDLRARE